jgi:hypothetical protein
MTYTEKNASKVKYSSLTSTPDCESVRDLPLTNILNLPQNHSNGANESEITESNVQQGNNLSSLKEVGNNTNDINGEEITSVSGNNNSTQPQTNNVDKNDGIVGIKQHNENGANYSGIGYSVTVNQCPAEIIEFIRLLAKKIL